MNIDAKYKMIDMSEKPDGVHPKMEKYILRKAFDVEGQKPYLPQDVLWRQKEQFSDGVGYSWVDGLRDYASTVYTILLHCIYNLYTVYVWDANFRLAKLFIFFDRCLCIQTALKRETISIIYVNNIKILLIIFLVVS